MEDLVIHRCDECQDKLEAKIEWENEQFGERSIVCPWCEDEFSDYEEKSEVTDSPYDDFKGEVKCPTCGKMFELEIETTVSYTTRKPSEQFDYEEWKKEECEV